MNKDHDPTAPAPPCTCGPGAPAEMNRRRFLGRLTIGLGALSAALVSLPVVGYIFAPFFQRNTAVWRKVGRIADFQVGETVAVKFQVADPLPWAGLSARTAAWLRRESESQFTAFVINCTHLGCPVRWRPESQLFLCPCHGGVYYRDGAVAAGPPPEPLPRYQVRLREGNVELLDAPLQVA